LFFFLAIIPASEYSTLEHVLQIHNNHSKQLSLDNYDEYESPVYTHVENMKTGVSILPFTIGNATNVKCSPRFSLRKLIEEYSWKLILFSLFLFKDLNLPNFLIAYRLFHSTLFAICIILVLILYSFIYNAIYQRRRARTRKFSSYRRILHSYIINNKREGKRIHRHSLLAYLCCYCCNKIHMKSSQQSRLHQSSNDQRKKKYSQHEKTFISKKKPEQILLEVKGARGKRYSAASMTSMTYLTSGVWDEASPTNLIRSRINSIAATTYCGTEHSSTSRPSTSTEDSFDQATKLATINNTASQLRSLAPPNSIYLTVPGQQTILSSNSNEIHNKDNQLNDIELSNNVSQGTNLLHPTNVRKSSNTLSIRQQQQRTSDASVQQRKVSFSKYFV
jgi:hypothetical protein